MVKLLRSKNKNMEEKSLGETRVRIEFNPAKNSEVDQLKQKSAELINIVSASETKNGEHARLKALAMTAFEEGAMWAVKAATI